MRADHCRGAGLVISRVLATAPARSLRAWPGAGRAALISALVTRSAFFGRAERLRPMTASVGMGLGSALVQIGTAVRAALKLFDQATAHGALEVAREADRGSRL